MKFALRLLFFAILFFILDKLFIVVANRSAETEVDKKLEHLVRGEINKDIIISGSSRGSRDIIAGQIEDSTGLTAYNLCYPGSNVEFHEFILTTLVKFNKPPRFLLLVVDDDSEFRSRENEGIIYRLDRLYPLVKYSHIRHELVKLGVKDKYMSKLFVLHWLNKANFDLRQKRFSPNDTILECGSMPISWQYQGRKWEFLSERSEYSKEDEMIEKVDAYREILNICNSNNIKLIVIFPPNYKSHSISFEKRIKELSSDKVMYYVYNADNPIYRNKDYFSDEDHLMKNGAIIFTDEVIRFLKGLINSEKKTDK